MKYKFPILLSTLGLCGIAFFLTASTSKPTVISSVPKSPLNVLFIVVDDLRPELNCYGNNEVISPNIDELASKGIIFNRAYCQYAVCAASRASILTGLRPDSTRVYDKQTYSFRVAVPEAVTLPQYFRQHGYHTEMWGKIFHSGRPDSISWTNQGNTNVPANDWPRSNWRAYLDPKSIQVAAKHGGKGPAYENPDVPDNAYPDGRIADSAILSLAKLKKNGKPFFLAVGFNKPHLPFNAPKKYLDLYRRSKITVPGNQSLPIDAPALALAPSGELRQLSAGKYAAKGPLTKDQTIDLIRAYRTCVSFMDAQVGRVLRQLKAQGLDKNTIVILWGDHGWKLGDYGEWCKQSNFEVDSRVPLILSSPGMKNQGKKTDAIVEFVDVYPTLAKMAGLPLPLDVQGLSFDKVVSDLNWAGKDAAYTQVVRENGTVMGYSIRTDRYRLTKWQKFNKPDSIIAIELYDFKTDPKSLKNVAKESVYRPIVDVLLQQMQTDHIGTQKLYYPVVSINR